MRSLLWLATGLARSHDVHLAYPVGANYAEQFEAAGTVLHPLPRRPLQSIEPVLAARWPLRRGFPTAFALPRFLVSTIPQAVRFRRVVASVAPKIVHVNEGLGFNRPQVLGAAMVGVPVVVHIRTVQRLSPVDGIVGRLVTAFVAVSEAAARPYRDAGFGARTTVVPNCVEIPKPAAPDECTRTRQELGIDAASLVLTAGRLIRRKGNRTALDAVAQLRRRGIDVGLAIVGDGPDRSDLVTAARELGIADAVVVLGFRDDMDALYGAADILLLPSQSQPEGFPRAVLEGMAHGLPDVATDIGGTREVFQNGTSGVLVSARGPRAIAEAIEGLISNPGRARAMGLAAREHVEREFSCERHTADMLHVYRSELNASGRSVRRRGVAGADL